MTQPPRPHAREAPTTSPPATPTPEPTDPRELVCLVIGPIGDSFAKIGTTARQTYEDSIEVWERVIKPACKEAGLRPLRADKLERPGEITEQVCRLLRDADVVIADVTGANPNVMYELGLRHTRNLLTLQIGEVERLPFDINVIRTIRFERSEAGLIEVRKRLRSALESGLTGGYDPVTATRIWSAPEDVATPSLSPEPEEPYEAESDDAPGFMDLVAEAEDGLSAASQALQQLPPVLGELGNLASGCNEKLEEAKRRGGGAKAVLPIVAHFAATLGQPTAQLEAIAVEYEKDMASVAAGMDVLIRQLEEDPERLKEATELVDMVITMSAAAEETLDSLDTFANGVASLEPISRVLRVPARRLRSAVERVVESTRTIQTWRARIDALPQ